MLYVKARINDDVEIRVNIYGDDIYCSCPDCGKEVSVDEDVILDVLKGGGCLTGISICYEECAAKRIGRAGD